MGFNVCKTQKLPLITPKPPLKLLMDPTAKLVAIHRALPVPVNWTAKVRANLDRNVALGVLEKELNSYRGTVFTGNVFKEFCKTWRSGSESPQFNIPTPTSGPR